MPRIAMVRLSTALLETLLGFALPGHPQIVHAGVSYEHYHCPVLELLLEGEDLPEVFTVEEGQRIQEGQILVQHPAGEARIEPLP